MFSIEFPDSLSEFDVRLGVVSRVKCFGPSIRLTIGDSTNIGCIKGFTVGLNFFGRFPFHMADQQPGTQFLQFAFRVKRVELLGAVGASQAFEDHLPAGMQFLELGDIINFVVDNDPEIVRLVVLRHLFFRKKFYRHLLIIILNLISIYR